MQKNDQWFKYL